MASMNPRGQSQIFMLKGLHHLIMKCFQEIAEKKMEYKQFPRQPVFDVKSQR